MQNLIGLSAGEDEILEKTDAKLQKRREQSGFETHVVYAVTDEYSMLTYRNVMLGSKLTRKYSA